MSLKIRTFSTRDGSFALVNVYASTTGCNFADSLPTINIWEFDVSALDAVWVYIEEITTEEPGTNDYRLILGGVVEGKVYKNVPR